MYEQYYEKNKFSVKTIDQLVENLAKSYSRLCPYHYTRYLISKKLYDILLIPYNILLTPGIRKSIGLDLSNSMIVIDESHNIGKSAEMALTYKLKFNVL